MAELTNPHDRFFKDLLAHPEAARDFLIHYLPANVVALLDVSHLELAKDSFVDVELREYLSDLLFKVRENRKRDQVSFWKNRQFDTMGTCRSPNVCVLRGKFFMSSTAQLRG